MTRAFVHVRQQAVLITGDNDGIGYETTRQLVSVGATVMLHAPDYERGADAVARLGVAVSPACAR